MKQIKTEAQGKNKEYRPTTTTKNRDIIKVIFG